MKKTILKIAIIALCLAIPLFVLSYIWNPSFYLTKFGKYDLEWMEGKTIVEVVDRYGPLDKGYAYTFVYLYGGTVLVLDTRSPGDGHYYVKSAYYDSFDPNDWRSVKDFTLSIWAKGKTLKAVRKKVGVPRYYEDDNAVLYDLDGDHLFAKLVLDGSVESEDSVVISWEYTGYVRRNEIPDNWGPVE